MSNPRSISKSTLLYYAVLCLVCIHFALAYTRTVPVYFSFEDFANGSLPAPYNARILMAIIFKLVLKCKHFTHLPDPYGDPLRLVMVPVAFFSVFFTSEAVRATARRLGVQETMSQWVSFCVPLMAYFNFILVYEIRVQTPYDLPQMVFFAGCLWATVSRNRFVFYVCFILATLNKETACFIIPVFGLMEFDRTRAKRWLGAELVLQCALWLALRHYATHLFHAQGQALALIDWRRNVRFLLNPFHWTTILSVFAFLWIPFLVYFKRIEHMGLQFCALLLPLWFIIMFVVGDILEIRIHSEWIGYIGVCLALIANSVHKQDGTHQFCYRPL